jgi:hypothetical protein
MKEPEDLFKKEPLARPSPELDRRMDLLFAAASSQTYRAAGWRRYLFPAVLAAVGVAAGVADWIRLQSPLGNEAAAQHLIYRLRAEGDMQRLLVAPYSAQGPAPVFHVTVVTHPQ